MHQIILPRLMEIGRDACLSLPNILEQMGCSSPFIVTDKMMVQLGYIQKITTILDNKSIDYTVFPDTIPEPTAESIMNAVEQIRQKPYDVVIALGGGSVIDSAKATAVLGRFGGHIRDYKFPKQTNKTGIPIIAIPTTAGTGSECTRVTIITDEVTQEKMLCVGNGFLPEATIIDYTLTLSIPQRTTADTGIDALTHAIEAYVSQKANLFSDQQALAAMRLIGPNLSKVYHNGQDIEAREQMMLGASLAGMAFSNSSVALVHGMSRPIGAFFHVPHGLSNAMLLPTIVRYSLDGAPERYAQCAKVIGFAQEQDDIKTSHRLLLEGLYRFNDEFKVPTLAEFGVKRAEFDKVVEVMADQALASGSPANNPKIPSEKQIIDLYQQLWP